MSTLVFHRHRPRNRLRHQRLCQRLCPRQHPSGRRPFSSNRPDARPRGPRSRHGHSHACELVACEPAACEPRTFTQRSPSHAIYPLVRPGARGIVTTDSAAVVVAPPAAIGATGIGGVGKGPLRTATAAATPAAAAALGAARRDGSTASPAAALGAAGREGSSTDYYFKTSTATLATQSPPNFALPRCGAPVMPFIP